MAALMFPRREADTGIGGVVEAQFLSDLYRHHRGDFPESADAVVEFLDANPDLPRATMDNELFRGWLLRYEAMQHRDAGPRPSLWRGLGYGIPISLGMWVALYFMVSGLIG